MTTTATIDQLRPGAERPGGGVNSRRSSDYAKKDIEDRLASIMNFGILRPLLVVPANGADKPPYYVSDGGLSREAIELGVKTNKLPKDYAVKIAVTEFDAATALAASVEANEQVLPPHPVKVMETFAELQTRGKAVEEIAALFRLKPKDVRGYLALGSLSPKIRKAWIEEVINEDAAKAFTMAKDQAQQDQVFDKLKKGGTWQLRRADVIRTQLVGDQDGADARVKFVGRKEYEAAGGAVIESLFDEGDAVSDAALLQKLVDQKITDKCEALVKEGWAWAEPLTNENRHAEFSWPTTKGGKTSSAKEKANAGCRVGVDRNGQFSIYYGLIRPSDVKKTAKAAGAAKKVAPEKKAPAKISNSLGDRLDRTLLRATQDALKTVSGDGGGLLHVLAGVVAVQLQPDRGSGYTPNAIRNKLDAIRHGLPTKPFNQALAKRFDAKDYLSSAPKSFVIKALNEAGLGDEAKKLAGGTKAAAWKRAVQIIPKTGWLPVELRTPHYDGPGAKTASKKKAA